MLCLDLMATQTCGNQPGAVPCPSVETAKKGNQCRDAEMLTRGEKKRKSKEKRMAEKTEKTDNRDREKISTI